MTKMKIPTYNEWADELESVPKAEQPKWIHDTLRNKANLHIFGRYFFPHIVKGDYETPMAHKRLIRVLTSPKSEAGIFPRSFAKSTWEKIDTLHDIVYTLEPVILYISNNLTDAGFHFESIKAELENNIRLRYIYGNLVPEESVKSRKWTNKHFETTNGVNLVARGAGKGRGVNIKNQRPTKIVADDIEDDEQVRSAERREKLKNWLYQVIFPSLDKERGRIKMIGTVLHQKCEVLAFYEKHGGIYMQATKDGTLEENSVSIWPQVWTIQDLLSRKEEIGTRAFMQEYMNEPTNEELANFNAEFIDNYTFVSEPKFTHRRTIIYLDPQAGESAQSDEFGLTLLAWEHKDIHRYVLEQEAGRESQNDQAKRVILMWQRNKEGCLAVGVEKVMNQTAVYQTIRDWKAGKIEIEGVDNEDRNIPLIAHSPNKSGSTRGIDKLGRLQMHEPAFERGEIHLRHGMRKLREQILFLGTKLTDHDDRADSLVGALELSYKKSPFVQSTKKVYNVGDKYKTDRARLMKKTIAGNLYNRQF